VIRRFPAVVLALVLAAATATAQPAAPAPAAPPAAAPPAAAPPAAAPPAAAPPAAAPPAAAPPAAAAPTPAPAPGPPPPTPDELARARAAFTEGKQLYDAGRAADAVEKFKESYRLSRNPLLLYNVAFTFDQLAQKDLALLYYRKFLTDAPDTAQTAEQRGLAAVRAQALGVELGLAVAAPAVPPVAAEPGAPAATEALHEVVDEAPPGSPLDVTASLPESAGWHATLYYRGAGAETFTAVPMRLRYRERVGRIPATVMTGNSVQYYLEVKDGKDTLVARFGRPSSPNLVHLDAAARPRFYPDDRTDPGALTLDAGADDDAPPGMPGSLLAPEPAEAPRDGLSGIRTTTWIATGVTGTLFATAVTFHLIAAHKASELEDVADRDCSAPPCRAYDDQLKDVADYGRFTETVGHVSLGLGVASAAVTGYLWYRELTGRRASDRVLALPVVRDDFVGGAASVRF
jgi:hypothetical protein